MSREERGIGESKRGEGREIGERNEGGREK